MAEDKRYHFNAGEYPPPGVYVCTNCGEHTVLVPEIVKELLACEKCKGKDWMKV